MGYAGTPRAVPVQDIRDLYLDHLRENAARSTVQAAELAFTRLEIGLAHLCAGGELTSEHLSRLAVVTWRSSRVASGAANKTANTEVNYVRAALRHALDLGLIDVDPLVSMKGLKTGKKHQVRTPRALTEYEVNRLVVAAEESDLREPAMFPRSPVLATLAMTGARWGEIASVRWGDFDEHDGSLTFRAETTKTEKARTIPLHPDVVEIIEEQRETTRRLTGHAPQPGHLIFRAREGGSLATAKSAFGRWFRDMLRAAAIPHRDERGRVVCVQGLRHTFATRLARHRAPQQHTQALLGHATARMTAEVYTQLRAEEARDSVNGLPSLGVRGSVKKSEGDGPQPTVSFPRR